MWKVSKFSMMANASRRPGWSRRSYSPLDPRFAGSNPAEVDGFFSERKNLSKTSFGREVKPWVPCRKLRQVKEPQAEIRASEPNLSDFSRSLQKATLMIWDVKSVVKIQTTTTTVNASRCVRLKFSCRLGVLKLGGTPSGESLENFRGGVVSSEKDTRIWC